MGKPNHLSWDQIDEMLKDAVTIGSHTLSDKRLPDLKEKEARREIFKSKQVIEKKTHQEVIFFSYPLGGFNQRIKDMVKEAGYMGAVATNPGKRAPPDDIYALKRIRISRTSDNLLVFWIESSGYYTFIKEHRDED